MRHQPPLQVLLNRHQPPAGRLRLARLHLDEPIVKPDLFPIQPLNLRVPQTRKRANREKRNQWVLGFLVVRSAWAIAPGSPPAFVGLRRGSLRSSLRSERRLEAAGVEPASLASSPAATTCLVRREFQPPDNVLTRIRLPSQHENVSARRALSPRFAQPAVASLRRSRRPAGNVAAL